MIAFTKTMLGCLVLAGTPWLAMAEPVPIVDTHVHFWHLDRPEGIYWIKKDNEALYRSFMPADHEPIAEANGVAGVVVLQAGQHLPDNQWNLDITAHNKALYRGVVGNLSEVIGTDQFKPLFEKLCEDPRYLGYRLSGRYQEGLSDELVRNLQLTAERGKTVDFLVGKYSLEDVSAIAAKVPELKIILDHFGNIVLDGEPLDPEWIKAFRAAAENPNVFCKVSALYGRSKEQPAPKDIAFYMPVIDLALGCFGEDRIVFGSDWPVTRNTDDYASVLELTRAYFDKKGDGVSEKLFRTNAERFYGLGDKGAGAAVDPLQRLKLPGVKIDLEQHCLDLAATVCLDEGTLELVACTKGTKEHESIVAVEAKAMHIHTALLLLGARNGSPAMQRRTGEDEGDGRWIEVPPSGGKVEVSLVVESGGGEIVERPIASFLQPADEEDDSKFPTSTFVFAGSHVVDDEAGRRRRYLADESGNAVTISTFGDELLCLPGMHAHANGQLFWAVDATHLPAVGASLTLRLRPKLAAAE